MAEQADHTLVEVCRDGEHSTFYPPEECGHIFIIKRQDTTEKGIENNSTGPDVHLGSGIQLS